MAAAEQLRNQKQQLPSADAVRELPQERTATSKHYLIKDGSYQAVISLDQQHYEDENGEFQDIVPFLIDEADMDLFSGKTSKESAGQINQLKAASKLQQQSKQVQNKHTFYRAPQVPFDVRLPKVLTDGYSISKKENSLSFIPQNALSVTGEVYGVDELRYSNVWLDSDVRLQVRAYGVKESIILKTGNAPSTFSFKLTGEVSESLKSGELQIQPAWLIDANGIYRDVKQSIRKESDSTYLDLNADLSGLQFPVTIDPTVYSSPAVVTQQDINLGNRAVQPVEFRYLQYLIYPKQTITTE